MKRLILFVLLLASVVILGACGRSEEEVKRNRMEKLSDLLEDYSYYEVLEALYWNNPPFEEGLRDIGLLLDEIDNYGKQEYYQVFKNLCDDLGYSYSAFFGGCFVNYNDGIIHRVNSECFEKDNLDSVMFIDVPWGSEEYLDSYLNRYSLCDKCFPEHDLSN